LQRFQLIGALFGQRLKNASVHGELIITKKAQNTQFGQQGNTVVAGINARHLEDFSIWSFIL